MLSNLLRSHSALRTQVGPGRASLPIPRSLADGCSFLRRHHLHYHLCPLPPTHLCNCWELGEGGAKIPPCSDHGCWSGFTSQEVPGFGVFSYSFIHPGPGLWGGVPWADLQSQDSGKRELLPFNIFLHTLWARPCAGRGGSEGKVSPPPRGAHLRGTDTPSITRTENVQRPRARCPELRGAERMSAGIQASIPESGWPAWGTRIPQSPPLNPPTPPPTLPRPSPRSPSPPTGCCSPP